MLDPYKMVVVSIALSIILISGLLFYRFIFPKRKINLLFLLILISILPIISIFRNGSYESGDFNIHIYRAMAFYDSIIEGNTMPSWAKDLNATYGYPLFIFNYPLPYYFLSIIHFLGFGFINSMKIFLALSFVLSGVFMYVWTKKLFKSSIAAFSSSVFYLFAPYHLIDLHFKVAIGEILAFTILPLTFLGIHKLYFKKNLSLVLILSIFLALLVMSHLSIAIFALPFMIGYIIFLNRKSFNKNFPFQMLYPFPLGLLITSYVWLGSFFLTQYTVVSNSLPKTVYFPTFLELLYSPWRMGFLFQGPNGELSTLIGYTQIFIVAYIFFLLLSRKLPKQHKSNIAFWVTMFVILIFFISPYSKFLWEYSSFLKPVGSHRLLIISVFCNSILAGYLALYLKKRKLFLYILIFATIFYTILNWGHRRVIPQITDTVLKDNLWRSTSESEGHFYANPKWVDNKNLWISKLPKKRIEVISGIGEVENISITSTNHKYIIYAKEHLKIQENTLYFPGWRGYINGKEILLFPSNKGIIQTAIPKGVFKLEVKYEDIFAYKLLKIVSMTGFLAIIVYSCIRGLLCLKDLISKRKG